MKPLVSSPYLRSIPPINPTSQLILTPASYATWIACLDANPTIHDFLVTPGDYLSWGVLDIVSRAGGTPSSYRSFRYYNAGTDDALHPVQRTNEARILRFNIDRITSQYWMIHGLTQRGGLNSAVLDSQGFGGPIGTLVDYCLIEETIGNYGIRFRRCTDATIQRCVVRNYGDAVSGVDSTGIYVGGIIDDEIIGFRAIDCEVYNYGDQLQISEDIDTRTAIEFIVDGCDFYITPDTYIGGPSGTRTLFENGIDIKAGSDTPDRCIVSNNRIWGFRRNDVPTALGEAIVTHIATRNLRIEDNIVGDCPRGFTDNYWAGLGNDDPEEPRNIALRRNQFYDIRDIDPSDAGFIARPIMNTLIENNQFSRCQYAFDVAPDSGYRAGGPTISGNRMAEVIAVQRPGSNPSFPLPFNSGLNPSLPNPSAYDTYERRRWTGPEIAIGASPLVQTVAPVRVSFFSSPLQPGIDLERYTNGDVVFPLVLARGSLGVAQRCQFRLQLFFSEWFLNRQIGFPWWERMLGQKYSAQVARQTVREQLALVPDVASVLEVTLDFNPTTRFLQIGFTIQTSLGDVVSSQAEINSL